MPLRVNGHIMRHEKKLGKPQLSGMSRHLENFCTSERALFHCWAWCDGAYISKRNNSLVTYHLEAEDSELWPAISKVPCPCPLPQSPGLLRSPCRSM